MEVATGFMEPAFGNPFADDPDSSSDDEAGSSQNILPSFSPLRKAATAASKPVTGIATVPRFEGPSLRPSNQSIDLTTEVPTGPRRTFNLRTCDGSSYSVSNRNAITPQSIERMLAARSVAVEGRAERDYYGIPVHDLIEDYEHEANIAAIKASTSKLDRPTAIPSVKKENPGEATSKPQQLWTEKYRAKRFTDLVGDERVHRQVLRWLKGWDPIVFPNGQRRHIAKKAKLNHDHDSEHDHHHHRKILVLTGPPGFGKTTLAHVAAKQVGYEVLEINASDDRSSNVVKGRIRDTLGTQSVRSVTGTVSKPVCVVVDEVDGVVTGAASGGAAGEGGFIHALIDLVNLDAQNAAYQDRGNQSGFGTSAARKSRGKRDNFRLFRPLILICNDLYHPSLKPLRQSSMAEIVYVKKPPLQLIINRIQSIFQREGVACESDAARYLTESSLGISNKKEDARSLDASGVGDLRTVLVTGQWAASLARKTAEQTGSNPKITRDWVERHISGASSSTSQSQTKSKFGAREVVERIFSENAGFSRSRRQQEKADSQSQSSRSNIPTLRHSTSSFIRTGATRDVKAPIFGLLWELVDSTSDHDRIATDIFLSYPHARIQDDNLLSKPFSALEWLSFSDKLHSNLSATTGGYELMSYLSTPILGLHSIFAANTGCALITAGSSSYSKPSGDTSSGQPSTTAELLTSTRADFLASERAKSSLSTLQSLHSNLTLPLRRIYLSHAELVTDLVPYLHQLISPAISPVLVGGTNESGGAVASVRRAPEREMMGRAVDAMLACGVEFEKIRTENLETGGAGSAGYGGFVYRVEPAVNEVAAFDTMGLKNEADGMELDESEKRKQGSGVVRYAVRQVLEMERRKEVARRAREGAMRRVGEIVGAGLHGKERTVLADYDDKENAGIGRKPSIAEKVMASSTGVKRDFFGRVITDEARPGSCDSQTEGSSKRQRTRSTEASEQGAKVWVSYHEGSSNATRKPITLKELIASFETPAAQSP